MPRLSFRFLVSIVAVLSASFMVMSVSWEVATPARRPSRCARQRGRSAAESRWRGDRCRRLHRAGGERQFFTANPNTGNVAFGNTSGDGLVSFPLDQFAISPEGAAVEVGMIVDSIRMAR